MPLFYVLLLLQLTGAYFVREANTDAEANVRRLVLAAYEREEKLRDQVAAVRTQIRQGLSSEKVHLEFDAFFSNLASKDFKNPPSKNLTTAITKVIPLDSLARLVTLLGNYKLQTLPLANYLLTRENARATTLPEAAILWQYLPFFNIQNGDKIGEIGAGSGWLSLILAILYDQSEVYVNDLSPIAVQLMQQKIAPHFTGEPQIRCHFVTGTKTSTRLESEALDVVIAVDVFHHFTDKFSMLQSIKWSLAKGGRLLLVEQDKDHQTPEHYCPEALEKWEVDQLLRENGFVKVREQPMRGQSRREVVLLEYVVSSL
jgi:SAM-dependent methyltransferase